MRKSFVEFVVTLGRWIWVLLLDILGGIVGAIQMVRTDFALGWTALTGLCLLIFVFAVMAAFHKMREQRDTAIEDAGKDKKEAAYATAQLILHAQRIVPAEADKRKAILDLCDQLERIEQSCLEHDDIGLAMVAGVFVIKCWDLGAFASNPPLEATLKNAQLGRTMVQHGGGFPANTPEWYSLWATIHESERKTCVNRTILAGRGGAIQGSKIIAAYIRRELCGTPVTLSFPPSKTPEECAASIMDERLGVSSEAVRDLRLLKTEGESLANTWEIGHPAGPEQWRKEWSIWQDRTRSCLERGPWPNAANDFVGIKAPDGNYQSDDPQVEQRERQLGAQIGFISKLLAP